jgi:phage terminase large subunit-like protein
MHDLVFHVDNTLIDNDQIQRDLHEHLEESYASTGSGYQSMSPALRDLESIILDKKLRHGDHPVLKFCATNAVIERDAAGNRKPFQAPLDR